MSATLNELSREETLNAVRNKNAEVLKEIVTGDFQDGGVLNRQQFAQFFQQVQNDTTAMDMVRTVPLDGPQSQIDKIGVGERQLRAVGEGSRADLRGIQTDQIDIDVVKTSLPWELTRETVEDTIEYENTAEIILSHFSQQYAVDMEDLAFNGDTAYSAGDSPTEEEQAEEDFRTINDGWLKLADERGAPYVDAGNENVSTDLFYDLAQSIEPKYHRSGNNVFFMSRNQALEYKRSLTERETSLGDQNIQDGSFMSPVGYPVVISDVFPDDHILFCDPENLIHAVHRDMRVGVSTDTERVLMNDLFAQYNLTSRFDFQIEDEEALAYADNVAAPWSA